METFCLINIIIIILYIVLVKLIYDFLLFNVLLFNLERQINFVGMLFSSLLLLLIYLNQQVKRQYSNAKHNAAR
jgi:hypothetical protein